MVIPESPELVIKDDAQYGAIEAHTSSAFTNLTRLANARAGQVAMPGKAFAGIDFNYDTLETFPGRGKLSFETEDGDKAMVELSVPYVLRFNGMVARKLIDIMSYFIGQSMIDADIENGVLTSDNIHVVSRIPEPVRKSPVKTLEEKLMECPVASLAPDLKKPTTSAEPALLGSGEGGTKVGREKGHFMIVESGYFERLNPVLPFMKCGKISVLGCCHP